MAPRAFFVRYASPALPRGSAGLEGRRLHAHGSGKPCGVLTLALLGIRHGGGAGFPWRIVIVVVVVLVFAAVAWWRRR
jgi:hypothetical protein